MILKLYVTDQTEASQAMMHKLDATLKTHCGDDFSLEVRDVFECTDEAIRDEVIVTPTLIRLLPEPVLRLIGDLSDEQHVLKALELLPDDG